AVRRRHAAGHDRPPRVARLAGAATGDCIIRVARATQAAQFERAIAAKDAVLALARFVPMSGAMFSKGSTSPPSTPARTRALSGSMVPGGTDRGDGARSTSESAVVAHSDSRPIESHWESVIDRATD